MSFLSRGLELKASADAASRVLTSPPPPKFTVGAADVSGLISGAYGLDTAMQVPAFARGVSLISGLISGLPLVDLDPVTGRAMPAQGLTSQQTMSPGVTNATLMSKTVTDMICHGQAFWEVLSVDQLGWPTSVDWIEWDRVGTSGDHWTIDGKLAPARGVGRVICFDTGSTGALDHGWLAIRTALSLETAAHNYASSPLPSVALKSTGLDLADDDAQALVSQWDRASSRSATRYLNSQVGVETFGWNAAELQLTEARQHAAIEIARLLNLDPYWLGAQPGGSSVTYSNEQDRRAALLDFTIMPLARVIEQRLSMPDVTGNQRVVRFTTMSFLRANLTERVAAFTAYVAAGILTLEEARTLEPLVQAGEAPE